MSSTPPDPPPPPDALPPAPVAGANKPVDRQPADYKAAGKTFADPAAVEPLLTQNVFQRGLERRWVDADGVLVKDELEAGLLH